MNYNNYPLSKGDLNKTSKEKLHKKRLSQIRSEIKKNKKNEHKFLFRFIINLKDFLVENSIEDIDIEDTEHIIDQELSLKMDFFTCFSSTEISDKEQASIIYVLLKEINKYIKNKTIFENDNDFSLDKALNNFPKKQNINIDNLGVVVKFDTKQPN